MGVPLPKAERKCTNCRDSHLQAQHIVRNATMVIYSHLKVLRKHIPQSESHCERFDEIKTRLQDIESALTLPVAGRINE